MNQELKFLEYELYQSTFLHLLVQEGIASDSQYAKVIKDDIKPGDLCLRDLGYFSTENLIDIDKQGGYFLSRMKNNMKLYQQNQDGKWEKIDLIMISEKLKRGEVLELDNIKVGRWVKNPLITRVIFTKLTEEQEAKRQIHIDKKEEREKSPFLHKKTFQLTFSLLIYHKTW
ncbi:transposase [Caldibacillus thermolactis]|uniref:Transposase n=1 Tax=Pallidibacillus thermolactis TaxID=251051 RepID=A0ABT2WLI3_9BACI|nr:transposase [Pallidibacillus thermolactis]MCU9595831.1 transposase [Pallidibacillus thermolactis]